MLPAEYRGMNQRRRQWLIASVGYIALNVGCGGTVKDLTPGGAGNAHRGENAGASGREHSTDVPGGREDVGGAPGHAGYGAAPGIQAGTGTGGDGGACKGDLKTVAASWWTKCPATLSAAIAWAESCPAGQSSAVTLIAICGLRATIRFDYGTHGKDCEYDVLPPCQAEAELVGAEAWDDVATYCDGTSNNIEAGSTALRCVDYAKQPRVVCGGPSDVDPAGGAGAEAGTSGQDPQSEGPLTACYNSFLSGCQPCCPATTPECSHEPDGYPGHACTPSPNSFCACSCNGGKWACGC